MCLRLMRSAWSCATLGLSIFLGGCAPRSEELMIHGDAETLRGLMDSVYSPGVDWSEAIVIENDAVLALDASGEVIGRARLSGKAPPKSEAARVPHIVLDPGHIGGAWGPMEQRHFQIADGPVFQEGDVVLEIALRVREALRHDRVKISLTRDSAHPTTETRPKDHRDAAMQQLAATPDMLEDPEVKNRVQARANLLFYRSSEIAARAEIVNALLPDLVVCMHIDGAAWPDPENPSFVEHNHLHVLVHGTYMTGELDTMSARLELLQKMALGSFAEELFAAQIFTEAFIKHTHLPPFTYSGKNATQVDTEGYIWSRNLAANRLFAAPVVFLEPYVANSAEVYTHYSLGDYDGYQNLNARPRQSLYAEYTSATVEAIRTWLKSR